MNRQIIDSKYAVSLLKPKGKSVLRQYSLEKVAFYKGQFNTPNYEVVAIYSSELMLSLDLIRDHMGASVLGDLLRTRSDLDAEFQRISELCDLAIINLQAVTVESE